MTKTTWNKDFFKPITEESAKPLLDKIGADMVTQVEMRFKKQVDPEGNKWAEHAESTTEARRRGAKRGKSDKILQDSGDLFKAVNVYRIDKLSVIVGTNLPYARTHQLGDESRGIVARPYLGISEKRMTIYKKWIEELNATRLSETRATVISTE